MSEPATVLELYAGDNNRVYVRFEDGSEADMIAEYCKIVEE